MLITNSLTLAVFREDALLAPLLGGISLIICYISPNAPQNYKLRPLKSVGNYINAGCFHNQLDLK